MKLWMDVMRDLEGLMADWERRFDAWEAGGVEGLVIGPLQFDTPKLLPGLRWLPSERPASASFDPDPAVYRRLGVEPPSPPADPAPGKRAELERMLLAAKARGWSVWIFQALAGAGPGGEGPLLTDARARTAAAARMVDTLRHYPMADGAIMDGPEWGYEIAPHFLNRRSYLFDDLPPSAAARCAELGFDHASLAAARDRLYRRLHSLTRREVARHAGGGLLGAFALLGGDPALMEWLAFRTASMTDFLRQVRGTLDEHLEQPFRLGVGPRTPAFGPLCGYDFAGLADFMDVLLPKHYFWHRGFDGMVGTVYRYVETLAEWSPGLDDASALDVVRLLCGLELPGVRSRADLEDALTPEFFATVVAAETRRALAAVDDPERVVPWVDTGRAPHDGDPMPASHLRMLIRASREAGLHRLLYHHQGNLTPAEWAVLSEECGTPWDPRASDYVPPDELVL